jgi:hypothetical protein
MSLLDRLRPKWQHSDPAIREQAVQRLSDQELLARIASDDAAESVRLAAILKLTDQKLLARFACNSDEIAISAAKRLTDPKFITAVALSAPLRDVRIWAVDQIGDNTALHRVSTSDTDPWIRAKARNKRLGPDAKRDFIRSELSKLQLAERTARDVGEVCGSLEDICDRLTGDGPFHINGRIEAGHEDPEGDETLQKPTFAQFLASKQEEQSGGVAPKSRETVFYEIHVWRVEQDTFEYRKEEKRLAVTHDSARWSRVSNGEPTQSPTDQVAAPYKQLADSPFRSPPSAADSPREIDSKTT